MIRLFGFTYESIHIEVLGEMLGTGETLVVNGREVARQRNWRTHSRFQFRVEGLEELDLTFQVRMGTGTVAYQLSRGGVQVHEGEATIDLTPQSNGPGMRLLRTLMSVSIVAKVVQTSWVLKAVLAGISLSGYAVLFSLPFALALVATLVFHEWGHVRAMKHFGIPTKGMYLIPFFGGLAVGEAPRSRWQEVYISMMGPVYGLVMSVGCYLLYLATSSPFIGLLASVSALINVTNLLPVHPLDGGRVVKALVFSSGSRVALAIFIASAVAAFAASAMLGLALLCFFTVIGTLDLLTGWGEIGRESKPRLDRYGIIFCAAWYVGTIGLFIAIILLIARTELSGAELAVRLLSS
jgi:putative peptide zinc metalloprotease protein